MPSLLRIPIRIPTLLTVVLLTSSISALAETDPGFTSTRFSDPDVTPCPACLAVAATGEVYVGVDLNGSLGKGAGKGRIVRLVDEDADGRADRHSVFAEIDNPRGLIALDTRVFALHTVIPRETNRLEAMHLSVLEDADHDGIADGPPRAIVSNISPPKHNQDRGADHTTNGIRLGIDGWIYIAVGDFGLHRARGTDGTELTMLGGGVVRVRPDGSELEIYTHGLRNIYDVAISPRLDIFTRGNTNDGGGWNVRFIHHVQSGEYGYPTLFKHFTDEIIPALEDLGGGSGTGALFLDEPGWPEALTSVPLMADWGRSQLVLHRLEADGASFTQSPEVLLQLQQISDLDVDGSGRVYLGAWAGAGYTGNPKRGWVDRIVPVDWKFQPFASPASLDDAALLALLRGASATARLVASQELARRPETAGELQSIAARRDLPIDARIAAIFTLKQALGAKSHVALIELVADPSVREWALRALTDRRSELDGLDHRLFTKALDDRNPRVRVVAAVSLGRLGDVRAANALLPLASLPSTRRLASPDAIEGPHASPDAAAILPHVAVRALIALRAIDACVDAIGGPHSAGALRALRWIHDERVVEALIAAHAEVESPELRDEILTTLIRLHHREAPYDGSWWWGTRPDTHGPYYRRETWAGSERIRAYVEARRQEGKDQELITRESARTRAGLGDPELAEARPAKEARPPKKLDLEAIARADGEMARTSIEDVILALAKTRGKVALGAKVFAKQGCGTCHTTSASEPPKGPYMGQVGAVLSRDQIAESILKPDASIAQGFASVLVITSDGRTLNGFVTRDTAEEIELRDVQGQPHTVAKSAIIARQPLEGSMMPSGLANALSIREFASLVSYLQSLKK